MSAVTQISEIQGIADKKVANVLQQIKTILDGITGRSNAPIKTLGANADLGGIINKVNEVINKVQGAPIVQSSIPATPALEVGLKLQDVTTSRIAGVTYFNTTGHQIWVMAALQSTAVGGATTNATVGGVLIVGSTASSTGFLSWISFPVQPGVSYFITIGGTPTVTAWVELR